MNGTANWSSLNACVIKNRLEINKNLIKVEIGACYLRQY